MTKKLRASRGLAALVAALTIGYGSPAEGQLVDREDGKAPDGPASMFINKTLTEQVGAGTET